MANPRICSIEGCGKRVKARGWCEMHYDRWRSTGDPRARRRVANGEAASVKCSVPGCDKQHLSRGWCAAHYRRWWKHGDPDKQGLHRGAAAAFVEHLVKQWPAGVGDECITWPYSRSSGGYAQVNHRGRQQQVHRLLCKMIHGPAPSESHQAAHSCGMGHNGCVNPAHVRWATPKQNAADKEIHGTALRGSRVPGAKLTERDVFMIRADAELLMECSEIASKYGVSPTAVRAILKRKRWAHV